MRKSRNRSGNLDRNAAHAASKASYSTSVQFDINQVISKTCEQHAAAVDAEENLCMIWGYHCILWFFWHRPQYIDMPTLTALLAISGVFAAFHPQLFLEFERLARRNVGIVHN